MQFMPNDSIAKFNPARFPFFDGITYARLPTLIIMILGCDVDAHGMKGV